MNSSQQYIDLYKANKDIISAASAGVMNSVRDRAFDAFCLLGLPTKKVERYKYIDVSALLAESSVTFAPQMVPEPLSPYVTTIRQAELENAHFIEGYYGKAATVDTDAIAALNTMLAQDGLFVHVKKNTVVEEPIHLAAPSEGVDRVLIVAEEGADAKIIFSDNNQGLPKRLTTQVVEIFVGDNAHLDIYSIEQTDEHNIHFSNTYIVQGRDSVVSHNAITLENGVTRNTLDLSFLGEGAECRLNGCVIASGKQFVDNNTLIHHRVPHCTSNELYKYVLNDEATGAFAGRVLVEKGAQKTVSQETNQNLCGSKKARMFTQPMLEIYADDVKCSHGSTVGQLSDAAIFYMQQRGIPVKEARQLLQQAFVNEVVDQMDYEPLRESIQQQIEKRFLE